MEERLRELELRFTEQQELLQQLSEVVYAQQKTIDSMSLQMNQLRQKMEAEPGIVDPREQEKPPHY